MATDSETQKSKIYRKYYKTRQNIVHHDKISRQDNIHRLDKKDDKFRISWWIKLYFYKQHFYNQRQAETGKNQAKNAKQHPEVELLLFENYSLFSFTLSSKSNTKYSNKCTKNNYVCLKEVMINENENKAENEK